MEINKIAASLSFLVVATLSSAASASLYNILTPVDQLAIPYTNFAMIPVGEFSDTYNFTISSQSLGAVSVTNNQLTFGSFQILNITGLNMKVFDGANNLLSISDSGVSTFGIVLEGPHHAVISGISTGASGGSYVMSMFAVPISSHVLAAVPVPAAVWLLGSGLLGLVGVARRAEV